MLGTISWNLQAKRLCSTPRNTRMTYPWNVSWDLIRHIDEDVTVLKWRKNLYGSVQVASVINVGSGSTLCLSAEHVYVRWDYNAFFATLEGMQTHFLILTSDNIKNHLVWVLFLNTVCTVTCNKRNCHCHH